MHHNEEEEKQRCFITVSDSRWKWRGKDYIIHVCIYISLVVALGIVLNILTYNNLEHINVNLILIIQKIYSPLELHPSCAVITMVALSQLLFIA